MDSKARLIKKATTCAACLALSLEHATDAMKRFSGAINRLKDICDYHEIRGGMDKAK